MHGLDWDDLRFVLAIAREHTLSKAAEKLGVTHTTVSRRVKAFEERMGVRLFDRAPDGFVPTAAGLDVQRVAEEMEGEVLALEGRVLGRSAQLSGNLLVSGLDFMFEEFHVDFASFMEAYPDIELTYDSSTEAVSLTRREADVVMRLSNSPSEHLVGRKVARMQFAVYGARSLVERVGEDAPLEAYPWLHWDERLNPRWMDQWLAKHAPGARVVLRVGQSYAVTRVAVEEGMGVNFMPCIHGDRVPGLVRLSKILEPFARDLWLLTHPDLRNNPRVRAFMDHMGPAIHAKHAAIAGAPDVGV